MNQGQEKEPEHVVVALSGGVDSAVAAALLVERGVKVTGVFMENWRKSKLTPHCTTEEDRRDALRVALHIGIPFEAVNFEKEYEQRVIEYFYHEYEAGRTPNPDVMCNKEIKFRAFLDAARSLGAGKIATGHYAQIGRQGGHLILMKGVDGTKDQSYFLHTLTQEQLARTLFPVGNLTKKQVRDKARRLKLPVAEKPDSQGICFVGPVNVVTLLRRRITERPGPIVTSAGRTVGQHRGLPFYTIGQREGLGVGGSGLPYYVAAKDPQTNTLVVAHGNRDPSLYAQALIASHPHWIRGESPAFPLRCQAVIRYRQEPQEASVITHEQGLMVHFEKPQRAVTPGQSVVLYDGEECLGGAVIENSNEQ